jgi:hypothetical protein
MLSGAATLRDIPSGRRLLLEEHPMIRIVRSASPEGRANNRRVEIVVNPKTKR